MKMVFYVLASYFFLTTYALAATSVISTESQHDFSSTVKIIEGFIAKKKLTLFTKIDHAKNAQKAGLKSTPNTVLIFGNPKVGTPIMQDSPSFGIDLPVKAQIYTNKQGKVIFAYNAPNALAKKHKSSDNLKPLKKMTRLLEAMAKSVVK